MNTSTILFNNNVLSVNEYSITFNKNKNVSAIYKNSLLYFSEILCTYIYVQYYRIIYYIMYRYYNYTFYNIRLHTCKCFYYFNKMYTFLKLYLKTLYVVTIS